MERRRAARRNASAPKEDRLLRTIRIQSIACAMLLLIAVGIRFLGSDLSVEVGAGLSEIMSQNITFEDLTQKVMELSENSSLLNFFFGEGDAVQVFSPGSETDQTEGG